MLSSLNYTLATPRPEQHLFCVELALETTLDVLHFTMPDWIPGSYMIRDYARHVVELSARVNGEAVPIEKVTKSRWRLDGAAGAVVLQYKVYAFDRSVRGAYLDDRGWFANGVCVFLSCAEATEVPHQLQVAEVPGHADWSLVTSLEHDDAHPADPRRFRARSYAELIDHPLLVGPVQRTAFEVYGVAHEVVVAGRCRFDAERVAADLKAVCETHVQLFGEPPPMKRYVFMVLVGGERAGGLEHRDCTVLSVPRAQLQGAPGSADYTEFLSLASHEYFHAWLVKRIRPHALASATLDAEAYTRLLWVFEGITSYYDELALLRAGLLDVTQYLERLAKLLSRVQRGRGRLRQSLADSSFDAWTRFYKQDENAPNAIVSYYAKGALVALCLDLTLRQRSDGAVSLDTVMRQLWHAHASGPGIGEADFETLVQSLIADDLRPFFEQAVRGVDDLPYDHYLAAQGVAMHWRVAEAQSAWLGCTFKAASSIVQVVHEDSPAQRAGLSPGDEIIAWQGLKFDSQRDDACRVDAAQSEPVELHLFRNDELLSLILQPAEAPRDVCILESKAGFESRRDQWLMGYA